eukprot:1320284-Amorphochlora_amoeboformis.AAC.1
MCSPRKLAAPATSALSPGPRTPFIYPPRAIACSRDVGISLMSPRVTASIPMALSSIGREREREERGREERERGEREREKGEKERKGGRKGERGKSDRQRENRRTEKPGCVSTVIDMMDTALRQFEGRGVGG